MVYLISVSAMCTNILKAAAHTVHTHTQNSCVDTHSSCLSSPEPPPKATQPQKPMSKKRHQSCLYNESERAVPCRITDCTQESIPSSLENRGEEEKEKKKKIPPNNAAQQQWQQQQSILKKRERECENEREHEAIERLFI